MQQVAYNIGDVLYVIQGQDMNIIPVRVVEVVTHKSLEGESIDYIIETPGGKKGKLKPSWHVFGSPDALAKSLLANAQRNIEQLVTAATERAARWNENAPVTKNDATQQVVQQQDDEAIVELPDGRIAKLRN